MSESASGPAEVPGPLTLAPQTSRPPRTPAPGTPAPGPAHPPQSPSRKHAAPLTTREWCLRGLTLLISLAAVGVLLTTYRRLLPVQVQAREVSTLVNRLTAAGKQSMAINMTAGLIQITDRPSAHRRVVDYIAALTETVERQVEIEAKLYDVTLSDQFQWGVNWQQVAAIVAQSSGYVGSQKMVFDTLAPQPGGEFKLLPSTFDLTSNNAWAFGGAGANSSAALNVDVVVQALQAQGEVKIVSQPRLRVMNNQTALIKVATDIPFFSQTSTVIQNQGGVYESAGDQIMTITVGTILAITPQISSNNWITLDISPTLSALVETVTSPSGTANAPKIDIKQASTLVRVPAGTTVIIGGLIQDASAKTQRKVPILGDIPILGYAFKGVTKAKQKKELVMFVTPRIVRPAERGR